MCSVGYATAFARARVCVRVSAKCKSQTDNENVTCVQSRTQKHLHFKRIRAYVGATISGRTHEICFAVKSSWTARVLVGRQCHLPGSVAEWLKHELGMRGRRTDS